MAFWGVPRIEVELTPGDWTDITLYVRTVARAQPMIASQGRQTELSGAEPGKMTFTLDDTDGRFTPGNVDGAYYPQWTQGIRVRVIEAVGPHSYPIFTGYLEMPEVSKNAVAVDNLVTVSAIDLLGLLERGRKFRGTLAEHIRYVGGDSLVAYWPFDDAVDVFRELITGNSPMRWAESWITTPQEDRAQVLPGAGTGPLADDGDALRIETAKSDFFGSAGSSFARTVRVQTGTTSECVTDAWVAETDERITFFAWYVPGDMPLEDFSMSQISVLTQGVSTPTFDILFVNWYAPDSFFDGLAIEPLGGAFGVSEPEVVPDQSGGKAIRRVAGVPIPMGFSWSWFDGLIRVWVGNREIEWNLTTSPNGEALRVTQAAVARHFEGSVSHCQLYIGAPGFTIEDLREQIEVGNTAHDRQRTDERIRMVARYVGIADEMLDLDEGTAYCGPASLAGKTAAQVMYEARDTERGLLYVAGDGRLTFRNREHTYDT